MDTFSIDWLVVILIFLHGLDESFGEPIACQQLSSEHEEMPEALVSFSLMLGRMGGNQ